MQLEPNTPASPHRRTYILGFIAILAPPIAAKAGYASGYLELPFEVAALLTLAARLGLIVLTVWYSLKLGLGRIKSTLLGLATQLMCMAWVVPIYLIFRKPEAPASSESGEGRPGRSKSRPKQAGADGDVPREEPGITDQQHVGPLPSFDPPA